MDFLTLEHFKQQLKVDDDEDDDLYLQFVNSANSKVSTTLFPYIDNITTGSIYFTRCRDSALTYARSLHSESIEQIKKSKHYLEKFDYELYGKDGEHGLVEELKKTPTERYEPISIVTTDFEGERRVPFSQLGYGGNEEYLL